MRNFLIIVVLSFQIILATAQGLIINEVSNGAAGNQEYYELVVLGSTTNPMGTVDLSGWIIDDNNGDFEGMIAGVGIATGHIRIKSGVLTAVKPGSIILIYNSAELIFPNDSLDLNEDCVYILPITSTYLENTSNLPTTLNSNYTPVTYNSTKIWDRIGLRNDGDAVQVRKPNGSFFHGFSYGDVTTPFPVFPPELGSGFSFNVATGSGLTRNYSFECGNFTTAGSFSRGIAPINETPGQPNSNANRFFLNALRTGTYDYTNLASSNNCGVATTIIDCATFLPNQLIYFQADTDNNKTRLVWIFDSASDIARTEIERSSNGYEFQQISSQEITAELAYSETDNSPTSGSNYYRLKIFYTSGDYFYSSVVAITINKGDRFEVFPNPTAGQISISQKFDRIDIYNNLGCLVQVVESPETEIDLNLPPGIYYLKGYINQIAAVKRIFVFKNF
jgi:hypothetical protein